MSVIERRQITMSEFRMDADSGTFTGYANLHGVTDSYQTWFTRDTWINGGLDEDQAFVLLDMHRATSIRDALGMFKVTNDEKGLRIDGKFAPTTSGQDARALAAMGIAPELSVGFKRLGQRSEEPGEIRSAKLVEVSLILKNMASQPGAELTAVRQADAAEVLEARDFNAGEARDPNGLWTSGGDSSKADATASDAKTTDSSAKSAAQVAAGNSDSKTAPGGTTHEHKNATKKPRKSKVGVKHPHKGAHVAHPGAEGKPHPHKGSHVPHPGAKGKKHPHKGSHKPRKKKADRMDDIELQARIDDIESRMIEPPEGSYEAISAMVEEAIEDWAKANYADDSSMGEDNSWSYVSVLATFPDRVVATVYGKNVDDDGESWQFPYLIGDNEDVTLGTPIAVELVTTIQPADGDDANGRSAETVTIKTPELSDEEKLAVRQRRAAALRLATL